MGFKYVIDALDSLKEHPDLMEYIETFEAPTGFMYTPETGARKVLSDRIDALLDPRGMHSGGSWGEMMRLVQAVLAGRISRETIMEKYAEEQRRHEQWKEACRQKELLKEAMVDLSARKGELVVVSTPEVGRFYEATFKTRSSSYDAGAVHYVDVESPREYVGKYLRQEKTGGGNSADFWAVFLHDGAERRVEYDYEFKRAFYEVSEKK